jgi:hypothetical protein
VRELKRQYAQVGVVLGTLSWRTFAPVTAVTKAIKPADRIIVEGDTYTVMGGAMTHPDMAGKPSHVILISERQEAGH